MNDQGPHEAHQGAARPPAAGPAGSYIGPDDAELFRLLVEQVTDYAIFILDPQGYIASWNPGAERIKGYRAEEIIGRHFSQFYPAEDKERGKPQMELEVARSTGHYGEEGWRIRKDGTQFWASVLITAIWDNQGTFRGYSKITRDLSERKQAEETARTLLREQALRAELVAREELLTFLSDASSQLGSSLDYEVTLDRVAHLAVPRLGDWCAVDILEEDGSIRLLAVAHKDPAKEQWARELRRLRPTDPATPTGVPQVLRTGKSEFYPVITDEMLVATARDQDELRLMREIGFSSCIVAALTARGRTLGALTLVATESARHYGTPDLALAEELARRAAMAVDNARLYREAQEGVRVREQFLSTAAHELKTPMTGLKLQLQGAVRAARKQEGPSIGRLVDWLTKADQQADRLTSLTERLLDVSRMASGRLALDLEPTDLVALTREVCLRFEEELRKSGSSLHLADVAGPITGEWDCMRLDQLLTNLIGNAIKYGAGLPIEVTLSCDGERALVAVRDQGIGIEPAQQARIFERFERGVSNRNYGGFGLGLWIARQITDALGGTIDLQSRPGAGSTFTVELPLAPPVPPPPAVEEGLTGEPRKPAL